MPILGSSLDRKSQSERRNDVTCFADLVAHTNLGEMTANVVDFGVIFLGHVT